jgi:putative ABC transport system substrate-binding protein
MQRPGRRRFLYDAATAGLAAATLPLLAECGWRSSEERSVPRIGYLVPWFSAPPNPLDAAFREGLHARGYVEGETVAIAQRNADGADERMGTLARELVDLPVRVLVTVGPPAAFGARRATRTIPIVMAGGNADPVGTGLVRSLDRPGGNLTGVALGPLELFTEKLAALLKEVLPHATRVALLWNPNAEGPFGSSGSARRAAAAAGAVGLAVEPLEVRTVDELAAALATRDFSGVQALWVWEASPWLPSAPRVVDLATRARLPVVATFREWAVAGALLTYGPSIRAAQVRAAYYVDRILRGATPAELPVERPTTFELVVNRATARGLGLAVPPALLAQATEVIE